MNRRVLLLLVLVLCAASAIRFPSLGIRPMHNDEGVNAYKFAELWRTGRYKYDHNEHHGPTLYYATYAWSFVSGAPSANAITDARLRVLTVLFGIGILALLPLYVDGLGRRGMLFAGVFTAVSPSVVFYSRYYIHEILLVFFTTLAIGAGWRYWRARKWPWALVCGAAVGLMDATKETFVITLIAVAIGLAVNQGWNRWVDASGRLDRAPRLNWMHVLLAFSAWAFVAVLLFSSFFSNPAGPLDSLRSYAPWANRAAGDSPHIHPWYFYWQRLLWFHLPKSPVFTEVSILAFALLGAWAGFARQRLGRASASFVRFVAIYTAAVAFAYCFISYKTPWCLLNFWHGVLLLAGVGAAVCIRSCRNAAMRKLVIALICLAIAHLGWQSWAANTEYPADPRNPHVYAHTSSDFMRMADAVQRIAAAAPSNSRLEVKVAAPDDDFWPMPWYFRNLPVGYYAALPPDPYAPMMIVSARFAAQLDEKGTHLMTGYYQLRPGVFFELYVELDFWKSYLAKYPPARSEE